MALMKDNKVRYRCRNMSCKGNHGCHADGTPYGAPGDARTRRARKAAHEAFDRLWKYKAMDRDGAYAWMRKRLGLTREAAHIGSLGADDCERLASAVKKEFPHLWPFEDPD